MQNTEVRSQNSEFPHPLCAFVPLSLCASFYSLFLKMSGFPFFYLDDG